MYSASWGTIWRSHISLQKSRILASFMAGGLEQERLRAGRKSSARRRRPTETREISHAASRRSAAAGPARDADDASTGRDLPPVQPKGSIAMHFMKAALLSLALSLSAFSAFAADA